MPIKIPDKLPAAKTLKDERIFVMTEKRAASQDIRPLKIAILNIMPTKITTETQLLRLLGNSPIQVDVDLLKTQTYEPKNTSNEHLSAFYKVFDDIKDKKYDGLIITGAPVEIMNFEDVEYWDELCEIMEWSKTHVTSTLHICWGAQAGLYYHFGIDKELLPKKISGVYNHKIKKRNVKLLRGFDDEFYAPHSRYTKSVSEQIKANEKLDVLAESKEAGELLISSKDRKMLFITGHMEYDAETLASEYFRDVNKGINPDVPENYFPGNDPKKAPIVKWRSAATLLFSNWINYYLYQETPYDISKVGDKLKK
ncbi:MAG: homoserine O-succinyltransferase [Clostridia bacterium]|nr:homoserine O-succinyltransferase [Clostridia bacterium]